MNLINIIRFPAIKFPAEIIMENIARDAIGMDQRNEYGGIEVTNPEPEYSPITE
jgi:hypothetical protein